MRSLLFFLALLTAKPPLGTYEPPEASRVDRGGRVQRAGGRGGGQLAFFEFAPPSGAGMGAPCDGAVPTGTKGEVVTFARATAGTCLKSNDATGIAPGDLVPLSANQPAVALRGTGMKVLGEDARTNSELRSEEFDNAAWTKEGSTTAPTVTANFGLSPRNDSTAERVQFAATSGAAFSDLFQLWTAGLATDGNACSFFVQGNGTSGTTDICRNDGLNWVCASCAFVPGSYTRCQVGGTGSTSTTKYCKLGNNSLQNGSVARSAADVLVWGGQGESAAGNVQPSSYIQTVAAAASRALTSYTINPPGLLAAISSKGSFSVNVVPTSAQAGYYVICTGAEGRFSYSNTQTELRAYDGLNEIITGPHGMTAGGEYHIYTYWDQALTPQQKTRNTTTGVEATGSFDGTWGTGATAIVIAGGAGAAANGWVGAIKIDPDSTRLR